eukprot:TRINITY_DN2060_c0_g1_i1.p1 TRINITY_DN2060_c0_g1~~TRINITY_DN2060_c0_g1_i1.p1  ORF type:complete len:186 (+),score=22.83 TRINITY_DN2060_c0_g1_i1:95-652(+)
MYRERRVTSPVPDVGEDVSGGGGHAGGGGAEGGDVVDEGPALGLVVDRQHRRRRRRCWRQHRRRVARQGVEPRQHDGVLVARLPARVDQRRDVGQRAPVPRRLPVKENGQPLAPLLRQQVKARVGGEETEVVYPQITVDDRVRERSLQVVAQVRDLLATSTELPQRRAQRLVKIWQVHVKLEIMS